MQHLHSIFVHAPHTPLAHSSIIAPCKYSYFPKCPKDISLTEIKRKGLYSIIFAILFAKEQYDIFTIHEIIIISQSRKEKHMINYNCLWETMKEKGITQYSLIKDYHVNESQLHRLRKNMVIKTSTINRLCEILDCEVGDICQYTKDVPEEA